MKIHKHVYAARIPAGRWLMIAVMLVSAWVAADPRDIASGISIYEHGYCDQPYVVIALDGAWVCVFTTSAEREGAASQYIVSTRSTDQGQTWSAPVAIEAPDGPEASWAMPLLTHFGRIYVFYVYNGDDVRALPDGAPMRADTHGWYCFRYSDDHGMTWSERHRLPMRVTACDRNNDFGGEVQMFWGIGKPVTHGDTAWFAFSKLARYFLVDSEGWFYRSDTVLTERDVSKVVWELLPEGDHGLRHPEFGSVQEEHNIVPLSNGDLYCVYRTTLGYAVESYSRDGGRSWSEPQFMRYADGRPVKNPRACPRLWRCANGNYLFWFHNHGGTDFRDRNPAWLSGGVERDGRILWSEPEIVLYGADTSYDTGRFSYPDLIEAEGRYWMTTTQKTRATIHEVDASLIAGLWGQFEPDRFPVPVPDPVLDYRAASAQAGDVSLPGPAGSDGRGFTLDLHLAGAPEEAGALLLEAGTPADGGISLAGDGPLRLHDGTTSASIPLVGASLADAGEARLTVTVDGAAKIITFVLNGRLVDGGDAGQYGWHRLPPELRLLSEGMSARLHPTVKALRLYDRPLRTSQAVARSREADDTR